MSNSHGFALAKPNESLLDLTVVSETKEIFELDDLSRTGKLSEKMVSKNNLSLERSFEESR